MAFFNPDTGERHLTIDVDHIKADLKASKDFPKNIQIFQLISYATRLIHEVVPQNEFTHLRNIILSDFTSFEDISDETICWSCKYIDSRNGDCFELSTFVPDLTLSNLGDVIAISNLPSWKFEFYINCREPSVIALKNTVTSLIAAYEKLYDFT